jgi:DNA-binding transcriptional regulator YiaG
MAAKPIQVRRGPGEQVVEGLREVRRIVESGGRLEDHLVVHRVRASIEPRAFSGAQVKAVRAMAKMSQAVFARMLAVSPKTLQSWEAGRTKPPAMACRLLELIERDHRGILDAILGRQRVEGVTERRRLRAG